MDATIAYQIVAEEIEALEGELEGVELEIKSELADFEKMAVLSMAYDSVGMQPRERSAASAYKTAKVKVADLKEKRDAIQKSLRAMNVFKGTLAAPDTIKKLDEIGRTASDLSE